jgi:hypothetical protein
MILTGGSMLNRKMIKLLSSLVLTITLSTAAYAEGGLEGSMKQMARAVKSMTKTIASPAMNAVNIKLADNFVKAATLAKAQLPEEIQQLPVTEQAKRKALYEEMIDHAIELGEYLSTSLKQNDQVKAQHFLEQIKAYEKEGHTEFKSNDLTNAIQSNARFQMATDLKSAMKNMGADLKLIQVQAADAGQNKSSLKLAEDFTANARDVKAFIPTSISSLPANDQQVRLDLYNKLTDKSIEFGLKLVKAFNDGNNAAAVAIINDLIANKKEGHFEFN